MMDGGSNMDKEAIAGRAKEHFASGYNCAQSATLAVKEALDKLEKGELKPADGPDVEGHW